MPDASSAQRQVVFVDGCRTPFLRSGTDFLDLRSYDLGRAALKGLVTRTGIDAASVDRVVMGTVIQNVATSNVAREAALAAGFPHSVPAYTVTMACISSSQAATSAIDAIQSGHGDMIVAGGTESMSDIPIQYKKKVRKKLMKARKAKGPGDYLALLKDLRPSDLLPEVPSIAEFSTGETMGESGDKLAAAFDVSREAQDEYALRSHQQAAQAREQGLLARDIVPVGVPPTFDLVAEDNGIRPDSSMEKLRSLPPAFVKPFGTVTAGNASFLTDGASACLLMEEDAAKQQDLTPRSYLRDYVYVAQDPAEELLLGPAYGVPKVLDRAGLSLDDIDVFEFHEAFAGQMLAVLRALASEEFARNNLDRKKPVGHVPMDKLNTWGGSLSLGHPFGATGVRLLTMASNRLHEEDGRYALVAACAAGGLGHAILLERYDHS